MDAWMPIVLLGFAAAIGLGALRAAPRGATPWPAHLRHQAIAPRRELAERVARRAGVTLEEPEAHLAAGRWWVKVRLNGFCGWLTVNELLEHVAPVKRFKWPLTHPIAYTALQRAA